MGIKIFKGNAVGELGEKIANRIGIPLSTSIVQRFPDEEIEVRLCENVRGEDVFIIQSTHPPGDNLLELLLMIDAAKRASAGRITAVIPYFGYSRQDKKDNPRVPISSKLIANLLTTAGASRVLTLDLHADQIQGFFDIPVDHLYATPIIVEYFSKIPTHKLVVAAPDVGRAKRAQGIAKRLGGLDLSIVQKQRISSTKTYTLKVVGKVEGRDVLLVDDIISTGGTIKNAVFALKDGGANKIYCYCTHPVLVGKAYEYIEEMPLEKLLVTDTIPLKKQCRKIEVLSVAKLLGEAILRIHKEESVSSLFIDPEEGGGG